jgi:hypothetical protein
MKTLTMTVIASLLIATPVLADGDNPVPPGGMTWQQLVDKANADRLARAARRTEADTAAGKSSRIEGDTAAGKSNSATDAGAAGKSNSPTDAGKAPAHVAPQPVAPTGRYNTMEDYWQDRS